MRDVDQMGLGRDCSPPACATVSWLIIPTVWTAYSSPRTLHLNASSKLTCLLYYGHRELADRRVLEPGLRRSDQIFSLDQATEVLVFGLELQRSKICFSNTVNVKVWSFSSLITWCVFVNLLIYEVCDIVCLSLQSSYWLNLSFMLLILFSLDKF
jgi:hypothetical protein